MRVFLPVYYPLAYYLSYFWFATFGLALNLACCAAAVLPATERGERFFQRVIHRHCALWVWWLSFARLVRFRFDDFRTLPAGPLVIVANHPGLMDITYLLARRAEAFCVFKPAIRRSPILGAAARRAGYLASDGGHELLRAAAQKVATGHTLIVFPEGTRSGATGLRQFKPGFALVARLAQAPIQLVRIACDSPLLVKQRSLWRVPPLPAHVTVTLGPRLPAPEPAAKTATLLAEVEGWFHAAARQEVAAAASVALGASATLWQSAV